jgi:pilus assembly protein FimV
LWIISQQIAEKNNIDIQTVMAQIQDQNPDAFVEQDASRLRNNVQLDLPSYDVVPSQQSLQTAIVAQRQQYQEPEKTETRAEQKQAAKDKAASKAKSEATKASKRADKPAVTKTQTLPQARFSVLAPGRDGSADGTQTKAAAETGDGLSTDILATLKASRQRNATQAKRLNATNSSLGSYTKKLQLQNRKLAELEARLKKLRNQ